MDKFTNQQLTLCDNTELVKYIEELRMEVEELKGEVNDRVVIEDIAHLFDKDKEVDDFDWEDEIGGMIKENKALKEQSKKIGKLTYKKIDELKKENDELKGQIDTVGKLTDEKINEVVKSTPAIMKLYGDIASLITTINGKNEEIKELKEQMEDLYDEESVCDAPWFDDVVKGSSTYEELKQKHDIADMKQELDKQELDKLTKEIVELKCPVICNRDSRCNQFDVRVGYSYAHDMLETALTEEQMEYLENDADSDDLDTIIGLVAEQIDKAINSYIRSHQSISSHILDYVQEDLVEAVGSIVNEEEWKELC